MTPIDIKVTAVLNPGMLVIKRNTSLILLVLIEYPIRKYNITALVQLFCKGVYD